jgi:hypothetical protein
MHPRTSKTLALLGGVATLALGSTFMLRLSAPRARQLQAPCAPRMLELERAECERLPPQPAERVALLSHAD